MTSQQRKVTWILLRLSLWTDLARMLVNLISQYPCWGPEANRIKLLQNPCFSDFCFSFVPFPFLLKKNLVLLVFNFKIFVCFSYFEPKGMCVFPDGNGFKTSTMRLGADVIVFSRATSARYLIFSPLYWFLHYALYSLNLVTGCMLGIVFNYIWLYVVVNYFTLPEGSVKCSFFLNTLFILTWHIYVCLCMFMWVIEKISALSIQPCIGRLSCWVY